MLSSLQGQWFGLVRVVYWLQDPQVSISFARWVHEPVARQ